ncbi:unnamed protein product, partial [Lymnaea stagnalis]
MSADLLEDDQHVSDIGLTVTVSFKDDNDIVDSQETDTSETRHIFTQDGQEASKCDQDLIEDVENSSEDEDEAGTTQEEDDDESVSEDAHSPEASSPPKIIRREKPKKIRKITVGRYNKYSPEDLRSAYEAIKFQCLSVNAASVQFGIPKSTLYDRLNERSSYNLRGRPNRLKSKILDERTEQQMVEHIQHMESVGQRLNQSGILALATKLAHSSGTIAEGRSISRSWYKAFLGRWPNVKDVPDPIPKPQPEIPNYKQPKSREEFCLVIKSVIDKLKLHTKPHLIYKVDEFLINVDKKSSSCIPYAESRSQALDTTTVVSSVLLCANAIGLSLPPYFITKKKKKLNFLSGGMDGSSVKASETGLVSTSVLKDFLKEHFLPNAGKKDEDQVLLLYGDQANIVTPAMAEMTRGLGIVLYTLPEFTHSCKLDYFYPIRHALRKTCADFLEGRQSITSSDLPHLMYLAIVKAMTVKNIKSSFLRAGIYPVDEAIKVKGMKNSKNCPDAEP